jgi:ribosomal protein S18 acetylase RimI-like enzyme
MFDPGTVPPSLRVADDGLLARVEDAGLNAAQPPEQLLYDGWLLRFSPGKAKRARSVNAVGTGRLALAEKLAHCRDWYRRAHLPLIFRITPFTQPARLDAVLAEQGFVAAEQTRVMVASPITGAFEGAPTKFALQEVDPFEFARHVGALRGSPAAHIDSHARRLAASPLAMTTIRLVAFDGARAVAAGQAISEGELLGLFDIVTAADARGRGIGSALACALVAKGAAAGACHAYLQVDLGNEPARHVYRKLGFVDRYAYWYRYAPEAVEPIPT